MNKTRAALLVTILIMMPFITACLPKDNEKDKLPTPAPTVATLVVTTTPTTTPTTPPLLPIAADALKLIYQDDFNQVKWKVSSSEDDRFSYQNGEYEIAVKENNYVHGTVAPVPEQSNFIMEVQTKVLSKSDKTGYGITFRVSNDTYYYLRITGNSYIIDKYQNDWSSLTPWTKSNYIKTDSSINEFRVACLGNTIEACVNGQWLVTLKDNSLTQGKPGLMVYGLDATVRFDNFKVYQFTDEYLKKAAPDLVIPTSQPSPTTQPTLMPTPTLSTASTYTLSVNIVPSGTGIVTPPGGEYDPGLQVTLIATPASGYLFDYWEGSASGFANKATITMNSNKSVTAHFKAAPPTPSPTPSPSPSPTAVPIPNIRGNWHGTMTYTSSVTGNTSQFGTWTLNVSDQYGSSVTGVMHITSNGGTYIPKAFDNGYIDSSGNFSFMISATSGSWSWSFNFIVSGNAMTGTYQGGGSESRYSGPCEGIR